MLSYEQTKAGKNSKDTRHTSLGRSTRTGPGRPLTAISKASSMRRGRSAMSFTRTFHLVHGRVMPITSASWNASLPIRGVGT